MVLAYIPFEVQSESGRAVRCSAAPGPPPHALPSPALQRRARVSDGLCSCRSSGLGLPQVHLQKVFGDVLQRFFPAGTLGLALPGSGPAAQPAFAGSHEGEAHGGYQHPGRAGVEGSAVHSALVDQHTCGGSGRQPGRPSPRPGPPPLGTSQALCLPGSVWLSKGEKSLEGGVFSRRERRHLAPERTLSLCMLFVGRSVLAKNVKHAIRETFISLGRSLTSSPESKELWELHPGPPWVTGYDV